MNLIVELLNILRVLDKFGREEFARKLHVLDALEDYVRNKGEHDAQQDEDPDEWDGKDLVAGPVQILVLRERSEWRRPGDEIFLKLDFHWCIVFDGQGDLRNECV